MVKFSVLRVLEFHCSIAGYTRFNYWKSAISIKQDNLHCQIRFDSIRWIAAAQLNRACNGEIYLNVADKRGIFDQCLYGFETWRLIDMLFGGQYVLLLMSLFSIYCGFIYNEFCSIPFHIVGSSAYKCRDATCSDARTVGLVKHTDTYPFGVDPSWRGSRSELPFLNSLKMKMFYFVRPGTDEFRNYTNYFNARYFNNSLDIKYQFVPRVIFLNSLFVHLSLLIIIKRCTGSQADLYHVMICMFLSPFEDLGENKLFWVRAHFSLDCHSRLQLLPHRCSFPNLLFARGFIPSYCRKEISRAELWNSWNI